MVIFSVFYFILRFKISAILLSGVSFERRFYSRWSSYVGFPSLGSLRLERASVVVSRRNAVEEVALESMH